MRYDSVVTALFWRSPRDQGGAMHCGGKEQPSRMLCAGVINYNPVCNTTMRFAVR